MFQDQSKLDEYFSSEWYGNMDQYQYSGWALIDQVKPGESVIDIGCGYNLFKGKIPNLIGVDPAISAADFKVTLEDFRTDEKFDVAFCLGSVNFGNEENIFNQLRIVSDLLKPTARIYWRSNPGINDHGNSEFNRFEIFPWTVEKHLAYAEKFGFECPTVLWDSRNRIYAVWTRSQQSNI
jgi:hypothetical protein